jgi:lactate dehydrogenase-like 2-hydroxyacid dehydrogenase
VGWADAVVVIAPLTEQTRGLIDAKVLKTMKRPVCVVEADLLAALESGQCAGLERFLRCPRHAIAWKSPTRRTGRTVARSG